MSPRRQLDPHELPPGTSLGFEDASIEPPPGIPEEVALVMPVYYGPPYMPDALVDRCSRCGQRVYRSPRNQIPYRLCLDCAEELGMLPKNDAT